MNDTVNYPDKDSVPAPVNVTFCSAKLTPGQIASVSRIGKNTWRICITRRVPAELASGSVSLWNQFRDAYTAAYAECLLRMPVKEAVYVPGSYFEGLSMLYVLRNMRKTGSAALYIPSTENYPGCFRPHEVYCSLKAIEHILRNRSESLNSAEKEKALYYRNLWNKYAEMPEVVYHPHCLPEYALMDILQYFLPKLRKSRPLTECFSFLTGLDGDKIPHAPIQEWPGLLCAEPNPLTKGILCRMICKNCGGFPSAEDPAGEFLRESAQQYCRDGAAWFFSEPTDAAAILKENTRAVKMTIRNLKDLPGIAPMSGNIHIPE